MVICGRLQKRRRTDQNGSTIMSSGVTLTSATRQNLLSLQGTADLVATTQNRLSTGKKVNSALDDPTSFFTSQALSGRSGDLGALLNGISNGVQTIQAANQGITSIQKLVDSAKSLSNQALADKSAISSGKAATTAAVSGNISFQGLAGTSDGTQDFSTLGKDGSVDITLGTGANAKSATIRLDSSTLRSASGDLTKVTAEQVVSAINSQIGNSTALKGQVSASVASDGRITFNTTGTGAAQTLNVKGSSGSTLDIGFGKASSTSAATVAGTANFATQDFGTNSASFSVSDGLQSVAITLDANTVYNDNGDKLGATATTGNEANTLAAINRQLQAAGSSITATFASNRLTFTGNDVGTSANVTYTQGTVTANLGFGTTATSVTDAGTGTVATGLTASGSDATDGSAKAIISGANAIDAAANNDFAAGDDGSFTIKLGDNPTKKISLTSVELGDNSTADQIVAAINKQFAADTGLNGKVEASVDSAGKLQINSTAVGANQTITINAAQTAVIANQVDIGFGQAAATTKPAERTATGKDSTGSTNSTRNALAKQFNEILNQITQQAKDSSYNGINLLYRSGTDEKENSLKVTFNETGSSSITIAGAKLDSDGLGLTAVTGGFQNDDEINKTLTAITAATSQLRAQSSTFGSNLSVVQNRQDFSKNLINILDTGSANLTNADLNEEAANSQALSTRQSLGISALSLANQANQGILQLLR